MRQLLLIFLFFSAVRSHAQVREAIADTRLQSVTVFSSGATLQRTGAVSLRPGRTEVQFAKLSGQLDPQSVQLKADADIVLLSVQASRDFSSARILEDKEKAYRDSLNTLESSVSMDRKLLEVNRREQEMLSKNQAIGGEVGVKTAELKEALDLHRKRLTELFEEELKLENRVKKQDEKLSILKRQLDEFSKKKDSVGYVVTALVDNSINRNVTFQLSYNIPDAGWYPTYDVRVTGVDQPLQILMSANVFQRSGETWKDVNLSLSSGDPADNATPPGLQPWMLGYYNPNQPRVNKGTPGLISGRVTNRNGEPVAGATVTVKYSGLGTTTDANGYFRLNNPTNNNLSITAVGYEGKEITSRPGYFTVVLDESRAELSEVVVTGLSGKVSGVSVMNKKSAAEEIRNVAVATEYQPTTTVYAIKDKYTIETDGKTTTIGIKQMAVPASYEYFTIPKIDASAFLTAKITDWQDYDLQSGEASLYFEGTYLGKTYIDLSNTSDTLSLSLGQDNNVKVSRKLIKDFSQKRWLGSNKIDSRAFEISVRNTKKIPVTITVEDQFPVSTNKEISVDDMKANGAVVDKETGLITWLMTLKPGEEQKVVKSYTVKYPKGRTVVLE